MRHARPFFFGVGRLDGAFPDLVKTKAVTSHRTPKLTARVTFAKLKMIPTEVNSVSLVIYTKPGCPYCQQAREYYNSKGLTFIDRDAQTNKEFRAEMFKYSGGDPTVPCIVKDGEYVQSGWGDPLRG